MVTKKEIKMKTFNTDESLTRIYKNKLLQKINDISIGNLAYEVIEEMEQSLNLELSETMINNFIDNIETISEVLSGSIQEIKNV